MLWIHRLALSALAAVVFGTMALSESGVPAQPGIGIVPYPGAVRSIELTARLEALRNIRWMAADALHVDAPLSRVLDHLRAEQKRREGEETPSQPRGRLREWLEKNPDQMGKYREFLRSQAAPAAAADWQIARIRPSEIPTSLGGGEALRSRRFARRPVEIAFGTIPLPDSVLRVQLLSPYPSADGGELVSGTLIALIREARETAAPPPAAGLETVDGPETAGLAARLAGWVVMDEPVGGMIALGIPGPRRSTVREIGQGGGVVHSLSGPDAEGRIAYVENHAGEGRHSVKTVRIDGSRDEVVFSRPGEAFFEMAIGGSIALSRSAGRIALVGRLSRFQTNRPSFPLRVGAIEIWDVANKSGRALDLLALDRRLSWFPDGRRLAYVELVPAAKAAFPPDAGVDRFGAAFQAWEAIPVVRILEVDSDRRTTLHVGWDPVVSADGKSVLLRDSDNRWREVEVDAVRSRPVRWPGDAGGAIALVDGLVIYWGLPTTGSPPEFTKVYSASVGPRPFKTVKVAELSSERFQTLIPSIDPRRELSFGHTIPRSP